MLIHNEKISGSTIFTSLSQQLNRLVIKLRGLSAAECLFDVQGIHYFNYSSFNGHISLNLVVREYVSANETGAYIDITVKLNQFDKFRKGKTEGTIG